MCGELTGCITNCWRTPERGRNQVWHYSHTKLCSTLWRKMDRRIS